MLKRSWVEINLNQIKTNYLAYKKMLGDNQKIMPIVKADAYGHGDTQIALELQKLGATFFGVSNIEEAITLRKAGVNGDILILGYTPIDSTSQLIKYNLTQTVYSIEYADLMANTKEFVKVHFAIDTGMNRIGLNCDDSKLCADTIRKYSKSLNITGLFTHLCAADSCDEFSNTFTITQINKFKTVKSYLSDINIEHFHYANSAGGLYYNDNSTNIIRLGIILYGLKPNYNNSLPIQIKPALSWKSIVSMVKEVKAGDFVGYSLSYKANKTVKVATIPTGYADGYNRMLSNKGKVIINGQFAPIIGKICMDQFMVDVTNIPNVKYEDEVILIGPQYSADDIANDIGTIGYEVVCNISKRVPRLYK